MKILFVFFFLTVSVYAFGQGNDTLINRAKMLVHADYTDFYPEKIEKIQRSYSAVLLKSKGISDCVFLKINLSDSSRQCSYYLVYSSSYKRFYRLSGFKNSDFNDFYNCELTGGSVFIPKGIRGNSKLRKYVLENVSVDEIDLKKYYTEYYNQPMNSLYDKTSCYRKSIIIKY